MTQEQHPITPSIELVKQWFEEAATAPMSDQRYIAIEAARWGADQELKACRKEIVDGAGRLYIDDPKLRVRLADDIWTARRPKPPSLKEQALEVLKRLPIDPEAGYCPSELDTIRLALEALPD